MLGRLLRNIANSVKRVFGIEKPDITTAETTRTPDIKPGDTVDLDDLGDTYSGNYYVDEVSHTVDSDDYDQHFDLKRNATDHEPESDDK